MVCEEFVRVALRPFRTTAPNCLNKVKAAKAKQ